MTDEYLIGIADLNKKLDRLKTATAIKAVRSAAMAATLPTVKEMKAAAPKGREVHRTYKGRLVAPGFLSRSVIRKTRVEAGKVSVSIGVKAEAFYGVTFLDEGTAVTQRRRKVNGVKVTSIKSYRLGAYHWFRRVFEGNANKIVSTFGKKLGDRIRKATA